MSGFTGFTEELDNEFGETISELEQKQEDKLRELEVWVKDRIEECLEEYAKAQPYQVLCVECQNPLKVSNRSVDLDNDISIDVERCTCQDPGEDHER